MLSEKKLSIKHNRKIVQSFRFKKTQKYLEY